MLELQAQEFNPDWLSKPADSLLGLMRRRGITVEAAANVLQGGIDTLRGLVRGTKAIDAALARSISATVGGSPTFWLKRQANYERALDLALRNALREVDGWLDHIPAPGSKQRRRLSEAEKIIELRKRLAFYGVATLSAWHARYVQVRDQTQFRTSPAFFSSTGSEALWLRLGELEAALTTTEQWNPTRLHKLLREIKAEGARSRSWSCYSRDQGTGGLQG